MGDDDIPPDVKLGTVDPADLTAQERQLLAMMQAFPVIPLPSHDEWTVMIGHLRFALSRKRRRIDDPRLGSQQLLVLTVANILGAFFLQMPETKSEGLHQPLALLVTAFNDLAAGTIPDLFKPRMKPPRRPNAQQIDDIVKGKASRVLDLLMKGGRRKADAAIQVSRLLKASGVRGSERITSTTVINWRARCCEGPDAVSSVTLAHFRDPLPIEAGSSPTEQVFYLIRELQEAIVIRRIAPTPPHSAK
jgi:hypothetical protein